LQRRYVALRFQLRRNRCIESFNAAINDAQAVFSSDSQATYNLTLDSGVYNLGNETSSNHSSAKGVINVSDTWPTANGLNISGAGDSGGSATELITDNSLPTIWGTKVSQVHFSGILFARDNPTTTFGTAVSCSPTGYVDITIPTGFPSVSAIYAGLGAGGMYLRAYDNSTPSNPVPLSDGTDNDKFNAQVSWGDDTAPALQTSGAWRLYFDSSSLAVPSEYCDTNAVVAVKSEFNAQAYYFNDIATNGTLGPGTNIGFNNITWQDESRGVWRDVTYAYVTNSAIVQRPAISGQAWVLSVPDGGPQIGQPGDGAYSTQNPTVSNFTASNTGDDTLAIFNDNAGSSCVVGTGVDCTGSATFSNITIKNSFVRDINLYNSCHVTLTTISNSGCNTSLFDTPSEYGACITDTNQEGSTKIPECTPDYPL
jgi:hypothetical protein